MPVVVAKFGGSSVKDAKAIDRCVRIVAQDPHSAVVVVSATQSTTNHLEELAWAYSVHGEEVGREVLERIFSRHRQISRDLGEEDLAKDTIDQLEAQCQKLLSQITPGQKVSAQMMDHLYTFGERLSSYLFYLSLKRFDHKAQVHFLNAADIIKTNSDFKQAKAQIDLIKQNCAQQLKFWQEQKVVYVTQGFIGQDQEGRWTTLGREGSDYTAALIGEGIKAQAVQIWTDVPGMATTDPRVVSNAKTIAKLSYEEAQTMARLGAKLFSETLRPVQRAKVPMLVASSLNPEKGGTWIQDESEGRALCALAVMDELSFYKIDNFNEEQFSLISKYENLFFQKRDQGVSFFRKKRQNLSSEEIKAIKEKSKIEILANQVVVSFVGPKTGQSNWPEFIKEQLKARFLMMSKLKFILAFPWP